MEGSQLPQAGDILPGSGAKRPEERYTLPTLSPSQQDRVQRAKKYALEQSIKQILVKQTVAHQQQQMQTFQVNVQRQQALALMCRIYVGSINYDVPESALKTSFSPFGPIKSLSMPFDSATNKHKGFAFIEYEMPESAALAVEQMNSAIMGGRNIKVGRPTNMPQALAIIQQLAQEAMTYNRLFVAAVHPELGEKDLQSVFEAFGKIRSVQLASDPTKPGKHRGFGYIEFEDRQACDDACQAMNLFDLGGQLLRVGRAVTPPNCGPQMLAQPVQQPATLPSAAALAAATITAKINAMEATPATAPKQPSPPSNSNAANIPPPQVVIPQLAAASKSNSASNSPRSLSSAPVVAVPPPAVITVPPILASKTTESKEEPKQETAAEIAANFHLGGKPPSADVESIEAEEGQNVKVKGREARHLIMQKLMRQQEMRVVVLRNMVGPEDLDPELEQEVTEECGKYGQVNKVVIYQEKQGAAEDDPIVVKIYVEFKAEQGSLYFYKCFFHVTVYFIKVLTEQLPL